MQKLEELMNKKRIVIVVFILIILGLAGYFGKTFILEKNKFDLFGKSVKGISTQKQENASLPSASSLQNSLQQKLDYIKQETSKLDIAEIASSSPQIQKLIKDLNSLKNYPSDQIKEVCQNICKSL
ncbi:MAG: hypothetical protein A3D74_05190 [Candidatus Levybacteria bacterium RIFCSPHIGHO2_02_FULL_37_13]|nr:MAG: hypothetical protein A3D74_05190 [Candidatus Levybacteria bacterium RIFCSPHIGHO2_02_FULL_37_13]OGH29055.1 MAG: hypothetical protein A3E40_02710 [Candidatus Levybacteria bacterium RIFCSPHIGHO2_12_FULL_37_9]OGH39716.1 MAG: hypothetical protein A3B41_00690 [Candidatus Levybacteria bacterium RIFCSPLOWO2_01_FULL_37_26]